MIKAISIRIFGLYAALILGAITLPVMFWYVSLLIDPSSFEKMRDIFKLFALCGSIALILVTCFEIRRRQGSSFEGVAPIVVGFLVCAWSLGIISQDITKSWDYICYENAAKSIVQGGSPYGGGYLYPPFMAKAMMSVFTAIGWATSAVHLEAPASAHWNAVFYLYQCLQCLLIMLAYILCYRFARQAGLPKAIGSILVAALLVFSTPLQRTLQEKQVNLWILDAMLGAMLLVRRHPIMSGWAIALSTHIKLYPVALLIPWALLRRWRVIAASLALIGGMIWLDGHWAAGATGWGEFARFLRSFPGYPSESNLGLTSLFSHSLRFLGAWITPDGPLYQRLVSLLSLATKGVVSAWFAARFIRRERIFADAHAALGKGPAADFRLFEHSMDILALCLLMSPVLWDHHFLIATPLAIWVIATRGNLRPWLAGFGVILLLGLPNFEISPLGYHRPVGLLLLLFCASPGTLFSGCSREFSGEKSNWL